MYQTSERVRKLKAVVDAATPGPWLISPEWKKIRPEQAWRYIVSAGGDPITGNFEIEKGGVCSAKEDADFIIAARNDMPGLIERAEYMAQALETARAHLRKLRGVLEASGSEQAQELAFLALITVANALAKWNGTEEASE